VLAVAALVAFIIAAILELTKTHLDAVIWLIIAGGILLSAEAIWGWNRGGRSYRRVG
jgi:hypothetical protein